MAETYRVIDLSNLYARFCPNIAFLILTDDENKAETVKRIRIEPKRFCDMKYREDENIRIILKNSSTGKYDVLEVPFQKGIYGMYNILNEKRPDDYYTYCKAWKSWDKTCMDYAENVTICDNAIVLFGENPLYKKLIVTNTTFIEGTNMMLKEVSYNNMPLNLGEGLLNKCLQGETITVFDFFPLIDNEASDGFLYIGVGDLQFVVGKEDFSISKQLGVQGGINNVIGFYFSKERIGGIPSMFFVGVLKAESKKQLLKWIDECFICEG